MIIIDAETTGVVVGKHQIVSLGAVDYDNGETFYEECRIYESDEWTQEALDINGFTVEQITDKSKQTPIQLYHKFLGWCSGRYSLIAGHNVGSFDVQFLLKLHQRQSKFKTFPFQIRYVDLHSVAYCKLGKSLSMKKICEHLGVDPEPTPHNALSGAITEMNCFKILLQKND